MDIDEVSLLHFLRAEMNTEISSEADQLFDRIGEGTAQFIEAWNPLYSVCIPASVTSIGPSSFAYCAGLMEVTFEPGSKLSRIDARAFGCCPHLKVLAIPSSVTLLNSNCFTGCQKLETLILLPDSQLVRLEDSVFNRCRRLSALFIPVPVESIGANCFSDCNSLFTLTFGSPSHVERLMDIPPFWSGFHSIPDSVKQLGLCPNPGVSGECVLVFGTESRLERIKITAGRLPPKSRCFVQLSSRSLKRIRSGMEFPAD
jgi:hypothetical protein